MKKAARPSPRGGCASDHFLKSIISVHQRFRRLWSLASFEERGDVLFWSARAARCRLRFEIKLKGLILAQNERWRRGLGMQVERERFLREPSKVADG